MRARIWAVLAAVLVVALTVGSWPSGDAAPSRQERVDRLSAQIRCPTCAGLSVAESDTPLAVSAREDITRRVDAGESDDAILQFFVSRYGQSALMSPPRTGVVALAWGLPVVLAGIAVTGAFFALRRWRRSSAPVPSQEDERLVAEALKQP